VRAHAVVIGLIGLTLAACSKTDNGDIVIKRPGEVDIKTTQDTLRLPTVKTRTDTVSTPVLRTQTETLIVKKPVIGSKKTPVTVPAVKKP